jgi:hypothetical protein
MGESREAAERLLSIVRGVDRQHQCRHRAPSRSSRTTVRSGHERVRGMTTREFQSALGDVRCRRGARSMPARAVTGEPVASRWAAVLDSAEH